MCFQIQELEFVCSLIPGFQGVFFFFSILMQVRGEAASTMCEAPREKNITSREPYKTVSTVYFILGILRTDLRSQGN